MGIYDRDYIRDVRPAAGGGFGPARMKTWSVTTWIIIVCVAIFVIDNFFPPRPVFMGRFLFPEFKGIEQFSYGETVAVAPGVYVHMLVGPNGQPIGGERYHLMTPLREWLHLSTMRGFIQIGQFWRLIGFQFLHANVTHLLFNMLGLFFFGPMVERYLGSKRYLAFYLLCGIFGALTYLALNLCGIVAAEAFGPDIRIPGLLFDNPYTPLIGASAGVFGILMAGAYLAPNAMVLVFFVLPMRLSTLAYVLVGVALISVIMGGGNAGGEAAHLGGAAAGFYFIRRPHHLHGFFDVLGRVDPTSHHYRRGGARRAPPAPRRAPDAEIDRILQKITDHGIHSLTEREKRILAEASGND
jgi:membrane associated rhomboid family serine protease